jgi:hypothetical protein
MKLDRIVGRTFWDRVRFVTSVGMDLIGNASYLGYLFGITAVPAEGSDFVFAPLQAAYLLLAYQRWDGTIAALIGAAEELAPATDIVPTCTLYHIHVMRQKYRAETDLPAAIAPAR